MYRASFLCLAVRDSYESLDSLDVDTSIDGQHDVFFKLIHDIYK